MPFRACRQADGSLKRFLLKFLDTELRFVAGSPLVKCHSHSEAGLFREEGQTEKTERVSTGIRQLLQDPEGGEQSRLVLKKITPGSIRPGVPGTIHQARFLFCLLPARRWGRQCGYDKPGVCHGWEMT
jgi:hypothetical protein